MKGFKELTGWYHAHELVQRSFGDADSDDESWVDDYEGGDRNLGVGLFDEGVEDDSDVEGLPLYPLCRSATRDADGDRRSNVEDELGALAL